jgi:hypothetical protein
VVEIFVFSCKLVISVICVFILIVSCSVFLNWVCWTRGNFLASRVSYISVCMSLRCVERRAGTSIFGHSANAGGGTVRVFCFWALFWCVCVIEQVGSWRDGTIEMVGGAVFKFSFSSVCC